MVGEGAVVLSHAQLRVSACAVVAVVQGGAELPLHKTKKAKLLLLQRVEHALLEWLVEVALSQWPKVKQV